jgi:hypothetical protein
MEGLTPASADDLPPLGELLVDDPFWQYPAWGLAREGAGHLRVWATAAAAPGYLAVVTETGGITSVTNSGLIPLSQMTQLLGVSAGTVKIWYHAGIVSGQRYNDKDQVLYNPPGPNPPARHEGRRHDTVRPA